MEVICIIKKIICYLGFNMNFVHNTQKLVEKIRSGVVHIEFSKNGNIIASGSGFISSNYLITNNHVYAGPICSEVYISWQPDVLPNSMQKITLTYDQFKQALKMGSDEHHNDYAILEISELKNKGLFNFTISAFKQNKILDEVLILGFPLEHKNLVCHRGSISSLFSKNGIDIIQLDASINASNSGGPLVDLTTGNAIGIVTRKNTGLSKLFDDLLASFDKNINILEQFKGGMKFGDMDIMEPFITSQRQMKNIAQEIERSANVGIGYAFSVEAIHNDINHLLQS